MPYKNKQTQKWYEKQWREEHTEDVKWKYILWCEANHERKLFLDGKSRKKNKDYYNWIARFRRTLKNLSE